MIGVIIPLLFIGVIFYGSYLLWIDNYFSSDQMYDFLKSECVGFVSLIPMIIIFMYGDTLDNNINYGDVNIFVRIGSMLVFLPCMLYIGIWVIGIIPAMCTFVFIAYPIMLYMGSCFKIVF